MFAALSEKPNFYRPLLNVIIMMAPITTIHNMKSVVLLDLHAQDKLVALIKVSMGPEVLTKPSADGKISSNFLHMTGLSSFGINTIADGDPTRFNPKGIESFMGHVPAGTSITCLDHYRQLIIAKKF